MVQSILSEEIQHYIDDKINADVTKLALQKNPFPEVEWNLVLQQLAHIFFHQSAFQIRVISPLNLFGLV